MKRLDNENLKKYNKKIIWIPYFLVIMTFIAVGIFLCKH